MSDDHIMCLDFDRRPDLLFSVPDGDTAARCGFAGDRQERVADYQRLLVENNGAACAKNAGAWPRRLNAIAQGTRAEFVRVDDVDRLAASASDRTGAKAFRGRKGALAAVWKLGRKRCCQVLGNGFIPMRYRPSSKQSQHDQAANDNSSRNCRNILLAEFFHGPSSGS